MPIDFRYEAKQSLIRAKQYLSVMDDRDMRHAALELRLAIEGLTYARAELLKDDIPPKSYGTWQPRKLMQLLEDIDPNAFKSSTLAVGEQTEPGKSAPVMHTLGTETVLTFKDVKTHYDALGFFVHLPTIEQAAKGSSDDFARLRARCSELVAVLEAFPAQWDPKLGIHVT